MPARSRYRSIDSPSAPGNDTLRVLGSTDTGWPFTLTLGTVATMPSRSLFRRAETLPGVFGQFLLGQARRLAEAQYADVVVGAGPVTVLLVAAADERLEGSALRDVQGADALGTVELVAGHGQVVDVPGRRRRRVSCRRPAWRRVWNQAPAALAMRPISAMSCIVPISLLASHDRHEEGIRADGIALQLVHVDHAVLVDLEEGDGKALFLEPLGRVEHAGVLYRGRHDAAARALAPEVEHGREHGVVGFRAAAREDDPLGILAAPMSSATEATGAFDAGPRLPAVLVHARRVGEDVEVARPCPP